MSALPTNEQALRSPYVRAFLDTIAHAEGTRARHGYYTLVGGSRLLSLAAHPNRRVWIPRISNYSTAAGRYQFLFKTWSWIAGKLKLQDFSERSQDLAAVELLRYRGALAHVLANRFDEAVYAARQEWASLPGAGYGQRELASAELRNVYQSALASGRFVAGGNDGTPSGAASGAGVAVAVLFVVGCGLLLAR